MPDLAKGKPYALKPLEDTREHSIHDAVTAGGAVTMTIVYSVASRTNRRGRRPPLALLHLLR